MKEIAWQGSYVEYGDRGLLGSLVSSKRDPPLSPEAAEAMLRTKVCTNGSDTQRCIDLYRKAATKQLGSTRRLGYSGLEWKEAEYERLGEALRYCGALETLAVVDMELSDNAAAAVVAGLASCTSLKSLNIPWSTTLTALPDLSALTSLQTLDLDRCNSLTALPDLSALTDLKVEGVPDHLKPWKAGGFKAGNFAKYS